MAFIHKGSCECAKSELDLFSVPPTQTSIESGLYVEYRPISSITDGAPIEFKMGDQVVMIILTLLIVTFTLKLKSNVLMELKYWLQILLDLSITFFIVCFHKWMFR